ncbi:MAG: Crp/Fnr family transcriptional regulator [Actinobacteria bacterium]|nr:Crp/Fnr family transcriptional regulator [Actinomycetota bacterium]MDI6830884.1 Crp/Fnr family transcriptional regulator [Actinomycetota bacterium]
MGGEKGDASRVNIFWKIPMFEFLEAEELDRLYSLCTTERFAKGEYIFLECDQPRNLYVVVKGEVKLLKQTDDGRETIVEMAYPGEIFGEEAVFDGQPYPMTAQALDDVELLSISRGDFFSFLRDNPDLALEIITELGARLREAQNTIRALAMERVEWRIARVLLMLSRKAGVKEADGVSIDLPLTRQDIADMAATTVETTIRVLSNFKKMGLVDTEKGKIILRDRKHLEEMVSEGCRQP